ncbi:WD repeat-containing protein 75 [Acropora cervicornis]|uniref:WD repeat-containing protein 75 n=1 Tax=Acropora cervicornis TaxID=6130 RepID=A0AAD9QIQ3_ACRCE|nr:WD repeat-containing protein 75 [Acropora cervicornis]
MVLDESLAKFKCEISQNFGTVRLVGGESLVSQRTAFSKDSKIRIYSTATGDFLRELKGHESDVTDLKINPTNHLQLVSCAEGEVIFWDYSDGRILKRYAIRGIIGGLLLHSALKESIILIMQYNEREVALLEENEAEVEEFESEETKKRKKEKAVDREDHVGIFNAKEKTKLRLLIKQSGNAKQTTINGNGNLLASVKGRNLYLWNFASEKLNTISFRGAFFTCAAFHPYEACIAAGKSSGEIVLCQGLDQASENPITTILHWHSHAVGDITFSHDGSTILSVGQKGVLVKWQYKTHQQQFLPRLGTPILHVAVSPNDSLTAVSQKDNTHNHNLGITFDPRSKALVTDNSPGDLQFYLPQTDHPIFFLDVVKENYIAPKSFKEYLVFTKIDHVAFNDDGSWLATVERRNDKENALELRLKFWEYKKDVKSYVPNTCVDPPHDDKVEALHFQPQQRNSNLGHLAVTASRDGKFKIWLLAEEQVIEGKKYAWSCRSVGYYGDTPCQGAAFSQDGSLLAVAYSQTITLWNPETNELRKTLTLPYPDEKISSIKFGANGSSQYLISTTKKFLNVWNLLNCSVYVFDPASPFPVAVKENVSKGNVVCMAFDSVSKVSEYKNMKMSQVYFLTEKQELYTLDFDETISKEDHTTSQVSIASGSEQQTEFLKIFGQTLNCGDGSTSVNRSGKGVIGTPSSALVKQIVETPSHVLPSVTSLCASFLQSFLVNKHTQQREEQMDEKDDSSESEEENMDVDEDYNDDEATNVAETSLGKLDSSVTPKKQPFKITENLNLESVDFSWLKEYFA